MGNPNNVLVTCGNVTDPRLQLGVDVADALTLVFMSDSTDQRRGVNITVFEINATAATVSSVYFTIMIIVLSFHSVIQPRLFQTKKI